MPFLFPHRLPPWQTQHLIMLSQAELPEDIIETDDIFRAPLVTYYISCGLPGGVTAEASIHTNVVTWQLAIGPRLIRDEGRLHIAAGSDIAYWFGSMQMAGFDTKLNGWMLYPSLAAGYRFDGSILTAEAGLVIALSRHSRIGDVDVAAEFDRVPGATFALYLEQPLWKNHVMVIGIKGYWTKFYYPSWAAFSTFDRHFWIPEFIFGLVL